MLAAIRTDTRSYQCNSRDWKPDFDLSHVIVELRRVSATSSKPQNVMGRS
jgi:hypothetical protein